MSTQFSFYWHDYETFGTDPARDRPCQFAGLRTNAELEPTDDPLVVYCRPAADYLPDPGACLVTGITPQIAAERGIPEYQFAANIHAQLSRPGTCGAGYNSIRFDDEITRHLLFRNLYEPYGREWQNQNSRWDLIDVVRMSCALRPEGLQWPEREDGAPSFRLEDLTLANGLAHEAAHDALGDVQATIALARKLRECQPKLWCYALTLRDKKVAARYLDINARRPVLHVSSRYPAKRYCTSLVLPLAKHPTNKNSVIVWDLAEDPEPLWREDPELLREQLYTRAEDLPEGEARPALKEVHLNRSPMLATEKLLDASITARLGIDLPICMANLERINRAGNLAPRLDRIFTQAHPSQERDPELSLYNAFIPDSDKPRLQRARTLSPAALAQENLAFEDTRLQTILFRYRARNHPDSLLPAEREQWQAHLHRWLFDDDSPSARGLAQFQQRLATLRSQHQDTPSERLLDEIAAWVRGMLPARSE